MFYLDASASNKITQLERLYTRKRSECNEYYYVVGYYCT